ncbi:hypothetical protein EMIT0P258_30138 [Pseudomonas sp. IT-P258]
MSQFFTFCDTSSEHVAADDTFERRVTEIEFWRHEQINSTKKPRTSRGFFILSLASNLDTTPHHQKTLIG